MIPMAIVIVERAVELVERYISMAVGLVEKGRDIHGSRAAIEREISMAVGLVERERYPWQ